MGFLSSEREWSEVVILIKEDLQGYKMSATEQKKWTDIKEKIRSYCREAVPAEFADMIERYIGEFAYYEHYAGYCSGEGYYYIEIGDRGAVQLSCKTDSEEEMLFFLMEKILHGVGRRLELRLRSSEQKNWMYYIDYQSTKPGKIVWLKNESYIYHTKHDTRKWWFEYIIRNLWPYFDATRVNSLVEKYTKLMNRWFEDVHWRYDREKLQFVEISDSVEKK